MAGVAGSVAPVFRDGGYDATATYDFYHAIIYNNKLYFCRQDGTVGHEPQEETDEYWFLSLDGNIADASTLNGQLPEYYATAQSVTDIEDGTTTVGNALKLNGLTADEFVANENLISNADFQLGTTRWTVNGTAVITVLDSGGINISCTGGYGRIHYRFTDETKELLRDKTLTLSISSDNVVNTRTFAIPEDGTYDSSNIDFGTNFTSDVIIGSDDVMELRIYNLEGADGTANIEWVKLELGSIATPFIPPNKEVEKLKCGVVDADTVDGYHASDYFEVPTTNIPSGADLNSYIVPGVYRSANATISSSLLNSPHTGSGFKLTVKYGSSTEHVIQIIEAIGSVVMYFRSVNLYSTSTSDWISAKTFLHLTGGTLSGNLKVGNGHGGVIADSNLVNLSVYDIANDDNNSRKLVLFNNAYLSADDNCLQIYKRVEGVLTKQTVLHTGNSAKTKIQSAAPADTTVLWVDTTNKLTKAYIDGAWTKVD